MKAQIESSFDSSFAWIFHSKARRVCNEKSRFYFYQMCGFPRVAGTPSISHIDIKGISIYVHLFHLYTNGEMEVGS